MQEGVSLASAWSQVKNLRSVAQPNPGFWRLLAAAEMELRGGTSLKYDGTGCPVGEEDREGVGREPCEAFDGIVDHGTSCNLI